MIKCSVCGKVAAPVIEMDGIKYCPKCALAKLDKQIEEEEKSKQ